MHPSQDVPPLLAGITMTNIRFIDLKQRRSFRVATVGLFLAGMSALAACQTPQQRVAQHEDNLAAAGFFIRPANTPERKAMLSRLPPNRFVKREKGDDIHYVYADPLVCNCLYVGSQQAYSQYKQHQQQQQLADEQQMTADSYSDSAWNWGAWGPGYGFGYGGGLGW
jgi:hypothetical protein